MSLNNEAKNTFEATLQDQFNRAYIIFQTRLIRSRLQTHNLQRPRGDKSLPRKLILHRKARANDQDMHAQWDTTTPRAPLSDDRSSFSSSSRAFWFNFRFIFLSRLLFESARARVCEALLLFCGALGFEVSYFDVCFWQKVGFL